MLRVFEIEFVCFFFLLPDMRTVMTCKILVLWKQNHMALCKVHFVGLRSPCTGVETLREIHIHLLGFVLHYISLKENLVVMVFVKSHATIKCYLIYFVSLRIVTSFTHYAESLIGIKYNVVFFGFCICCYVRCIISSSFY